MKGLTATVVAGGVMLLWLGTTGGRAAENPDPSGTSILFLSSEPQMDPQYGQELTRAGVNWATVSLFHPLEPAFLRRFNVFVVDRLPPAGEEWAVFGQRMIALRQNLAAMWDCVEAGAGALVYPNLADCGGGLCLSWNEMMRPYGVRIQQACVIDPARNVVTWKSYGESGYTWTEALSDHPVTRGLARVYYAGAILRWDDLYTTPPLLCDPAWTVLVRAMPGARVVNSVDQEWLDDPLFPGGDPVLAAARPLGKGRLAVLAICPGYLHRLGYQRLEKEWYGEQCFGVIDGIILAKGDGKTASDTGRLLTRLYGWLAGDSAAAGFGGYRTGEPVVKQAMPATEDEHSFTPVVDFETVRMPKSWRHRPAHLKVGNADYYPEVSDPFVTGELRFFRGLIGAHSALSDGQGSVAEYAAAARQAGYALLVFTEAFEKLSRDNWEQLVRDCQANSGPDFVCLPGLDILDPDGNHMLIVAPPYYPRANWLTADGKRLAKTQMVNLLYGNHLVVVHRTGSGPLPVERLKHFQGLTVYTYREGKLVDEALHAYAWQTQNGSNPHPLVVHELLTPAQVATAAAAGFQQLLPADTVANAVGYFRSGLGHYFDAPARYLISEGPTIHTWVIYPKDAGPLAENRMHFRVDIGVRSSVLLTTVTLYDGQEPVRQWRPGTADFVVRADFEHARQHGLWLFAEDSQGRRAIANGMRTVAGRYHSRCADRQNWLGHVGAYYTGTLLPNGLNLVMPVKDTAEASAIFTDVPGTSMAIKLNFPFTTNDVVLTECVLDERYTAATFKDVGFDAMPSRASAPSSVYAGKVRRWSFTPGREGQPYPTLFEVDLVLRRDAEPRNPAGLFPAFLGLVGKNYARLDADGRLTVTEITPDAGLDLPVGALAGGIIALSPGLRVERNTLGLAPARDNPARLAAGTRLQARFLVAGGPSADQKLDPAFDADPSRWLTAMGFAGATPYRLELGRGKLVSLAFVAELATERGGVAGIVAQTADIPYLLPLELHGVNPNWPTGVWREDGSLAFTGGFEQRAWPRLDVGKAGRFYAGNLVTADRPEVVLAFTKWTRDAVRIEAHNPTTAAVTATIATAAEVADRKPCQRQVQIPAGATLYVE